MVGRSEKAEINPQPTATSQLAKVALWEVADNVYYLADALPRLNFPHFDVGPSQPTASLYEWRVIRPQHLSNRENLGKRWPTYKDLSARAWAQRRRWRCA
jgi:hypothetical protein